MKYAKPKILLIESALAAIQGSGKPKPIALDSNQVRNCTSPAYEADE
jgi:hypothetical protein